jgi:hypothetical protein
MLFGNGSILERVLLAKLVNLTILFWLFDNLDTRPWLSCFTSLDFVLFLWWVDNSKTHLFQNNWFISILTCWDQ